eukprot:COSAG05_NODE_11120_length_529_cov_2.534884_1_plen_56_part_10
MPILTFTLKGDELKHHTVNLHKPLNLRYFKLLHVSTNISSANLNRDIGRHCYTAML